MRIGELASLSGVATSTLRFYESNGLLFPARRAGNGYRDYPSETVERIGLIRLAQSLGFTLEQIRKALAGRAAGEPHELIVQGLHERLTEIEQLQQRLTEQRQGILGMLAGIEENWAQGRCQSLAELLKGEVGTTQSVRASAAAPISKQPRQQSARGSR